MKKILALSIAIVMMSSSAWADNKSGRYLNKVILPLHAEQWLTTNTALVNVTINAAVADQGIEKVRSNVLLKLQELAGKGEWHILSFNRQQDSSGLESIQISAQARLDQADLNGLRDKAKSISKAGETYTIDAIEFTPSEAEIRAANVALRLSIYQQAKTELDTLNNMYPDQKYYLHKVDFLMRSPMPMQKNLAYDRMATTAAAMPAPALPVGNKAELSATVVLASTPADVAANKTE